MRRLNWLMGGWRRIAPGRDGDSQTRVAYAAGHFNDVGHPIMKSHMPGEEWKWCFVEGIGW